MSIAEQNENKFRRPNFARFTRVFDQVTDHSSFQSRAASTQSEATRTQVVIWVAIVIGVIVLSLIKYDSYQLGTDVDDVRYIILSEALFKSETYGMLYKPGEADDALYPFGYPLLLVPFVYLSPAGDPTSAKFLSLIATIFNAGILFWGWPWFSRQSRWWALGILSIHALSPLVIDHTRRVMSEPVFMTFCLLAILLAEKIVRSKTGYWWNIAMGLTLTFVLFTRTIGVVLIAWILVYLLYRKGLQFVKNLIQVGLYMGLCTSIVVAATSVQLSDLLPLDYLHLSNASLLVGIGSQVGIADEESIPVERPVIENEQREGQTRPRIRALLYDYLILGLYQHIGLDFRTAILPFGGGLREQAVGESLGIPLLPVIISVLTFLISIFGYILWYKREGFSCFNTFPVIYFGILFLWVWNGPRLLYPIQPQLLFAFLMGIEVIFLIFLSYLVQFPKLKLVRVGLGTVILILLVISVHKSYQIRDSRVYTGDFELRTNWIKANTESESIIMSEAQGIDYLYSGRKTVYYPFVSSSTKLEEYLASRNVDYILLAPKIEWQEQGHVPRYSEQAEEFIPLLEDLKENGRIQTAFESEQSLVTVFEVK